jgi:hypothetical protein
MPEEFLMDFLLRQMWGEPYQFIPHRLSLSRESKIIICRLLFLARLHLVLGQMGMQYRLLASSETKELLVKKVFSKLQTLCGDFLAISEASTWLET